MRYLLNILFSIIILLLIFYLIDVNTLVNVLVNVNLFYVALAIFFYIILNILMSLRIKVILDGLGNEVPLKETIISSFTGMLASDFTPARSGYFFTAFDLSSRLKLPLENTMISIFGPQLLEFTIKSLCVGILAVFVLSQFEIFEDQSIYIILSAALIFLVVLFFGMLLFSKGFLKKFSFIKKLPLGGKFFSLFHMMQANSGVLLKKKYQIIGLTLGSWFLKTCEWFCLAKSLNISLFDPVLEFLFIGVFQASVTLIHFMPIPTIAGMGTSEAAFGVILLLFGVPIETGVAFGLLTRGLMIFVDFIFGVGNLSVYIRREKIKGILDDIQDVERRAEA